MKFTIPKFIFVSLFAIIPFYSSAQDSPCEKFKKGIFRMAGPAGDDYIVTRRGDKQIESKAGDSTQLEFKIEWLNDCSYKLSPEAKTAKKLNLPENLVLTVRITSSTDKSYHFTSVSNFSKQEQKGEMIQLRK